MFGFSHKRQVAPEAAPKFAEAKSAQIIPFPAARVPPRLVEAAKQHAYEKLAESLGFYPAELVRAQLLEFFETEAIDLYDYAQVEAWLTQKKAEAKATHWCWRPLRAKDVITGYMWGVNASNYRDGFYRESADCCRPYERLVPMHALQKVAKIETKFGDRVKFFVSDYASLKPDPFIMVRPALRESGGINLYHFVFDVWDEPGFGA